MASVLRIATDDFTGDDTLATAELRLRRCPTCGEEYPSDYVVCPRDATPIGLDDEAEDPLLGVVLAGSYRIVRTLGRGGMGRLYEAQHARLDRRFAVKVLHEAHSRNRDTSLRFEREARALSRIRSDHVLDVVDVLRTPDDRAAIITARLDGEDLKARLDRIGKMPAVEAIPIARQVCRGLAAAHAQGVVHRDLKPSNLFLETGADGHVTVKILDFGVAKLSGEPELTRTGAVVGTPAYMAPEQARGSAEVDERADVYAVGAVLYRALTGRAPYTGSDAASLLTSLLHEAPKRPRAIERSIPLGLEAILQRAMARLPEDRHPDALALEQELAAFDEGGAPLPHSWEGEGPPEHATLVLPRGSVARAEALAKAARRARPLAFLLGCVATVASAALVVLASAGLSAWDGTRTPTEESLIWVLGGAALVATGTLLVRALGRGWSLLPEVERANRRLGVALVAGATTLGAFELAARALGALDGTMSIDGAGLLLRALLGAGAAAATLPFTLRRR